MIIFYLGLAIFIIGGIGLLISAFKTSLLWGLACFFIAPISIIYLILYWQDAKNPFFLQLIGIAIIIASTFMQTT